MTACAKPISECEQAARRSLKRAPHQRVQCGGALRERRLRDLRMQILYVSLGIRPGPSRRKRRNERHLAEPIGIGDAEGRFRVAHEVLRLVRFQELAIMFGAISRSRPGCKSANPQGSNAAFDNPDATMG
jgi:hypothetical protein